jgi:hypothetical protein
MMPSITRPFLKINEQACYLLYKIRQSSKIRFSPSDDFFVKSFRQPILKSGRIDILEPLRLGAESFAGLGLSFSMASVRVSLPVWFITVQDGFRTLKSQARSIQTGSHACAFRDTPANNPCALNRRKCHLSKDYPLRLLLERRMAPQQ